MKVKVGLAGCGFIGNVHARSIVLAKHSTMMADIEVELVVVADTNAQNAEMIRRQYGWKNAVSDWRALFDYDLDLIIVALPNSEHFEIVAQCCERNIAVLLEKPIAATLEESLQLKSVASGNDRIKVGYMNRFLPAVQYAKQLIADGGLGNIRMVRSVYLLNMRKPGGTNDWRFDKALAGHGASDDLGSHHIDLLRFLVGEMHSVQGIAKTWSIEDAPLSTNDDAMCALITFKSGAFGTMNISRTSPGHPLTGYIEIDGEKGSIKIDRNALNNITIRNAEGIEELMHVRPAGSFGSMWALATVQGSHPFGWHDCFAFQMAEMIQIAAGVPIKQAWLASIEDGIRAMEITESMIASSNSNKHVRAI